MKNWVHIDDNYLDDLRKFESRIPFSNYGKNKFKPFFSPLFQVGNLIYVTQISSPKSRHQNINEQKDFKKLYNSKNQLIGVINLNYMFPVPSSMLNIVAYKDLKKYRSFKNFNEESSYIQLLKLELSIINNMDLDKYAKEIYYLKYSKPNNIISKRCLDFKSLESFAKNYLNKNFKHPN